MPDAIPTDAYAMIIGAMKSGTTSLYAYLQDHPQICPASTKEPEFFSTNQLHGAQTANYNDLFSFDSSVHKYTLEGSTGYTKHPFESDVPKRIFDYKINPKFIYIIRDPFERIESHYNSMKAFAWWQQDIVHTHLISISNYFLQLEQYRRYFPIENILLLDFDELKNSPSLVLQKVYAFLDISHDYFPEAFEATNVTPSVPKLIRQVHKSPIASLVSHAPPPLKRLGRAILRKASPPVKRLLTAKERAFVHNELAQDISNLQQVYGFDVSKWC